MENAEHLQTSRARGQYNGGLDFWKLIFTLVIVIYHTDAIGGWDFCSPLGASAVEFFFMLSGYFMAVSASKRQEVVPGTLGRETAGFIWHKIRSLLPYYLFGYTLSIIAYIRYSLAGQTRRVIAEKLSRAIPNFLLLSTSGIQESSVLGMSWYISAMLLAMWFLYPLLRKYRDMYLHVIAPLLAVLTAGYISKKYGDYSLTYELDIFVTKEILRAVAGLNIGCVVYVISEKLKTIQFTRLAKVLLAVIEWGCYLWVLVAMHFMGDTYVFTLLFLYFFALCITTSKQSILGGAFDHPLIKATNRFSLALYLCHSACRKVVANAELGWGYGKTLVAFLALSIFTAVACMIVVYLLESLVNRHREGIKRVFVKMS